MQKSEFVKLIEKDLSENIRYNKPLLEKVALQYDITDSNLVKELTELAIVNISRKIAHESATIQEKYNKIVELYYNQPSLSHRTSQTFILQQFSTPCPISYLGGVYCKIDKNINNNIYFEPCAGNGMLTIAGNPENFIVNEIDRVRLENLKTQNFKESLSFDASVDPAERSLYKDYQKHFDAILTNPPFGSIQTKMYQDKWKINKLEFYISLLALETMKDNGRAFIIIGGHTPYDDKGYLSVGNNSYYLNCLYNNYNVEDVINIDGDLYAKQGTSFPVRVILINGRKSKPEGFAPQKTTDKDIPVKDFQTLYTRIMLHDEISDSEKQALKLEQMLLNGIAENNYEFIQVENKEKYNKTFDFVGTFSFDNQQVDVYKNKKNGEYFAMLNVYEVTFILQSQSDSNLIRGKTFYKIEDATNYFDQDEHAMDEKGYESISVRFSKYIGFAEIDPELHDEHTNDSDVFISINAIYDEAEDINNKNNLWDQEEVNERDYPTYWIEALKEHANITNQAEEYVCKKLKCRYLNKYKDFDTFKIFDKENIWQLIEEKELESIAEDKIRTKINVRFADHVANTANYFKYDHPKETYFISIVTSMENQRDIEWKFAFNSQPKKFYQFIIDSSTELSEFQTWFDGTLQEIEIDFMDDLESFRDNNNLEFTLDAPYYPGSKSCFKLDTVVPDSMAFEMKTAIDEIKNAVGSIDDYVMGKLKLTEAELCNALAVEQVDAVAMAIYNFEVKKQGMIIGDQTGIGKGRVAAAIVRYAVESLELTPVFMTEKTFLFSDIYRDLTDINCGHYVPFITNSRDKKSTIKDQYGKIVYQAPYKDEQEEIIKSKKLPGKYKMVFTTYSQYNSPNKRIAKPLFLEAIANNNILIMDEAHNSSGDSNTGKFMQKVIESSRGVLFLSATFAKRPDNMPVYALKTCISEANMTPAQLVEAIQNGGVALQEILASQLVLEGQMIRRERSFEGIEVNYIYLNELKQEHSRIVDDLTEILRDIIAFQKDYINVIIQEMDEIYRVNSGVKIEKRKGVQELGVTNTPFASKVFNVINQMLFSLKADSVAKKAIERLKEGKKPIIAFSSTMESFLEYMKEEHELPEVEPGEEQEEETEEAENKTVMSGLEPDLEITIPCDFSTVLNRALDSILRFTEIDVFGNRTLHKLSPDELSTAVQTEYKKIYEKIRVLTTNIYISPIDYIIQTIRESGFSCEEITGRKHYLQINTDTGYGMYLPRKSASVTDIYRKYNDNEIDCILINQSGSTGASAHARPTPKVPKEKVKQRVMEVLQAELNINTEIQKRGRINRTGQILKPIYDYLISAIPSEQRLMMMLQKKLKSLDANTTSNQKQSSTMMDVPDFLNKIGDKIVVQYLLNNPQINAILNDPLKLGNIEEGQVPENAAYKVSGRVAILPTKDQESFYTEMLENYINQVDYLKQTGDYDLEVEAVDLQAKTLSRQIVKAGKGGRSVFGDHSFLEKCEINVLKKPYSSEELKALVTEALKGLSTDYRNEIVTDFENFVAQKLKEEIEWYNDRYRVIIENISQEKKIKALPEDMQEQAIKDKEVQYRHNLKENISYAEERMEARIQYLKSFLEYFYIGQKIMFPSQSSEGFKSVLGICLGISINKDLSNPYAPSSVKIRFALTNSLKYIVLTASGEQSSKLLQIKGASSGISDSGFDKMIESGEWNDAILKASKNRETRYIITGNIIQVFTEFKGKLISFTTDDDRIRKGILMPEDFKAEKEADFVQVPIIKILSFIKNMSRSERIATSITMVIKKGWDDYTIEVPASRKEGLEYFADQGILDLMTDNRFEKVGNRMEATLPFDNIEKFIDILQKKNVNVSLSLAQFETIKSEFESQPQKEKIVPLRIDTKFQEKEKISMDEAEAYALQLELELLTI